MWRGLITHIKMSCHIKKNVTYVNESRIHMNESCHTWMSHVTHEWVMSHMNKSCHTWMSHVTHEWVMSHFNLVISHVWMRYATIQKTMRYLSTTYQDPGKDCWCPDSFTWMRILVHQQCVQSHAQESQAMHVCTSHNSHTQCTCVRRTDINRRIPVLLTAWLSTLCTVTRASRGGSRYFLLCDCVTVLVRLLMSWYLREWVMLLIWVSHGIHINESCHTHRWVLSHANK